MSDFENKKKVAQEFNAKSGSVKRGVAIIPIKFAVTMGMKVIF